MYTYRKSLIELDEEGRKAFIQHMAITSAEDLTDFDWAHELADAARTLMRRAFVDGYVLGHREGEHEGGDRDER